ncbi:MAG: ATPase [Chitinivibrionales bacterium]|nr:ATPase [Chitinivibrionales bacterium]
MKIAIPIADGKLCMHFGHCEQFAVVTADEHGRSVTDVQLLTPPPHEPGVLPQWLNEQGVNVIIAGGMGMRAQRFFGDFGIQVIVGAPPAEPKTVVEQYLAGTLVTGDNVCGH